MAVADNINNAEARGGEFMPDDLRQLRSVLETYRERMGRDRRAAALSAAVLALGAVWVVISALLYLNIAPTLLGFGGLALTVLLPLAGIVAELITRPSLVSTARILDTRMDNQQRLVTALELGGNPAAGPLAPTQVATTTEYLLQFQPDAIAPIRKLRASMSLAVGLICFALALLALKDTSSVFNPVPHGILPDLPQQQAALVPPTAQSGLPPSELTVPPTAGSADAEAAASATAVAQATTTANSGAASQNQIDQSSSAQSDLSKLGSALNGQSAAQSAADNLRNGNYDQAAKDLADLGANSDQLSDQAKKDLAGALDKAALDTNSSDNLRRAEQQAADALRNGQYKDVQSALSNLGQTVRDTAADVLTQQQLAQSYPSPTAPASASDPAGTPPPSSGGQPDQAGTPQTGQNQGQNSQQNSGSQSGQQGQQSQNGQNGQSGSGQSGQSGQQGQQGQQGTGGDQSQSGQSGDSGQNGQQGQNGQSGQTGGGQDQNWQGQSGSPGDGHRESGPTGPTGTQGAQDPFQLDNQKGGNQPTSNSDHPALSLDNSTTGSSSAPGSASPGSASNTPGETSLPPVERWGIIQKYFGGK